MQKVITLLTRTALIVGLLVALTPCGFCHSASLKAVQQGHSCCAGAETSPSSTHSDRGPLCQVMDQASLCVASVHLDLPAVTTAVFDVLPSFQRVEGVLSLFVPAAFSPPRSPQVLRI